MHRAYLKNLPAIDIVASGLHDSVGLYKRPRPEQMETCEWWMDIFGIADLKERSSYSFPAENNVWFCWHVPLLRPGITDIG